MKSDISVIIPLYNKVRTVERALKSVLEQHLAPREIVVVDDGSTDGSGEVVERLAQQHPEAPLRLLRQENAGVSAARNRAVAECSGEYVALLDADDWWTGNHLVDCRTMMDSHPGCAIYATAFHIDDGRTLTAANTPRSEGLVDFFAESLHRYVVIPSAAVLRRDMVTAAGGFPEGMRMGEDQYLWVKLAREGDVCFTPKPSVIYSKAADNRSTAIYRPEVCRHSFAELLQEASSDNEREYIAKVALGKALVQSAKGGTEDAAEVIRIFSYTKLNRRALRKLKAVNTLPAGWRQPLLELYNSAAWLIARKGL